MNKNDTYIKCTIEITKGMNLSDVIADIENTFENDVKYDYCGDDFYDFHILDNQIDNLITYCKHQNYLLHIEK